MEKKYLMYISKSILFKGFKPEEIERALGAVNYSIRNFSKGEVIAIEGDQCNRIGIVMDGEIAVQKVYFSGKVVNLTKLSKGDIFGEVVVFSNHGQYPATIVSQKKSAVLFISRGNIIGLCREDDKFLQNFMNLLSNKILMLNKKVENLSLKTIRQKICRFIIEEYKRQEKKRLKILTTRNDMAESFGIPRPSLSRELVNMREEGLISFGKGYMEILDIEAIEEFLM
ncbi:cAMP-binding domain of CRP or a regulatory subunit of cAMP-dependent protein kinases [Peptoclostridium litorale DSM 5388]|uniref:Cyclic nucleotide-binding protein n=1 Tax=Peptoclostridium litorale DSM 5388 TaxID=1121324 RepID=A0A069RF46_PEPLI|nr:Crp/Fnr family transcriptional regulator [Peptoclostridium litorale]KDR94835.1 cyclic nucleotide-binding protein [Peptoclostridium litorale DSM 5388]SIN93730.1 cAMP-binding domain of CRP or a regulatory subunit of cAMP-dependent protein kinases [Peptoclostridium litorale DSM 5388]